MTPLAHKIANELTLPPRDRTFRDKGRVLERFDDLHCFEVSDVFVVAAELAQQWQHEERRPSEILAFLPAARTWIEYQSSGGARFAWFLEQISETAASCTFVFNGSPALRKDGRPDLTFFLSVPPPVGLPLLSHPSVEEIRATLSSIVRYSEPAFEGKVVQPEMLSRVYVLLAMINTPRVFGRRSHMPHAGLQRALAKARGMVGKFPLHTWTEIKLEVSPPKLAAGDQEIRLSGSRALHFCRAYLRIRLGQLELVSGHWRGDPALGIKRSRYRLVLPKDGKAA